MLPTHVIVLLSVLLIGLSMLAALAAFYLHTKAYVNSGIDETV